MDGRLDNNDPETSAHTINSSPPDSEFTDEEAHLEHQDDYNPQQRLTLVSYQDEDEEIEDDVETNQTLASPVDFSFRKSYKRRRDNSLRQGTLSIAYASLNILNSTLGIGFLTLPSALSQTGLPLGIVLIAIITLLAAGSHIVLVNTGRYLGVRKIEDVGGGALKLGTRGKGITKFVVRSIVAGTGFSLIVSYLKYIKILLHPLAKAWFDSAFLQSSFFLVLVPAIIAAPFTFVRSLSHRTISRMSVIIALTYPVLLGLIASRSMTYAELKILDLNMYKKLLVQDLNWGTLKKHAEQQGIWSGVSTIAFSFASQHLTFPHHRTMRKSSQQTFNITVLLAYTIIFILALPFAVVPYVAFGEMTPLNLFDALPSPNNDGGVDAARVVAAFGLLGTIPFAVFTLREAILRLLHIETEQDEPNRRTQLVATGSIWLISIFCASIGSYATYETYVNFARLLCIALGYLLPSVFFVILYHVKRPAPIVVSSNDGLVSTDALLARKERQLQKRRSLLRLWQDLFIFSLLPFAFLTTAYCIYALSVMSENISDADRIRQRRLERLGTPAGSPAPQPEEREIPKTTERKPQPVPAPARISAQQKPQPQPQPSTSSPKLSSQPAQFDITEWESRAIESTLKVTIDLNTADATSWTVSYLKPLLNELEEEQPTHKALQAKKLTPDLIDQALIARLNLDPNAMMDDGEMLTVIASLPSNQTTFEYLVGAWRRARGQAVQLNKIDYSPADKQRGMSVINKLKELLLSYIGLTLQDPTMFVQTSDKPSGAIEFLQILIPDEASADPYGDKKSTRDISPELQNVPVSDLLADIVKRFDGDGLEDVITPIIELTAGQAKGLDLTGMQWRSIITALETLLQFKPIAGIFTTLPSFIPTPATAKSIENDSLLGPLIDASLDREEQSPITQNTLRATLDSLQASLFGIFNVLVRTSPQSRERVLDFFAIAANLNGHRGAMRVDPKRVSGDGFMFNCQVILSRFADPFMDATFSKIDKIDPKYFCHSKRLDISEETKIKADKTESDTFYNENSNKDHPVNFISEVFYLSLAFHYLGYHSAQRQSGSLKKHIDMIEPQLNAQRNQLLNDPRFAPGTPGRMFAEKQLEKQEILLKERKAAVASSWIQLDDPASMTRILGFYTFVTTWIVRFVDPSHQHPQKLVTLPLPDEMPVEFKMMPEYILESTVDFFIQLTRYQPHQLESSGKEELMNFLVTFICSPKYIGNPYSRNKIVEIMWNGTHPYGYSRSGVLSDSINYHKLSLEHLMPSLMSFYIDVERTGVSSQFYDRLNVRYNIARLLKVVWNNPTHRDKLKEDTMNSDKFVRFTNLVMNDSTYLLDEALGKLASIRQYEEELNSPGFSNRPDNEREEVQQSFEESGRAAGSYTALGGESVRLLKAFTAEAKAAFMAPEIVDRLAAMLCYNLDALAGPRCQELKVTNPEKYGWRPRQLLTDIIDIFMNLLDCREFIEGVAKDGRSYSKTLFERAAGILRRKAIKTDQEVDLLARFVNQVEQVRAEMMEEDEADIPEEYQDMIMATLMRDPVILPGSKAVLDRSTIKSHLLSDNTDPFNRSPLTIDQVVPHTELKAEIDEWVAKRRQAKLDEMTNATNAVDVAGTVGSTAGTAGTAGGAGTAAGGASSGSYNDGSYHGVGAAGGTSGASNGAANSAGSAAGGTTGSTTSGTAGSAKGSTAGETADSAGSAATSAKAPTADTADTTTKEPVADDDLPDDDPPADEKADLPDDEIKIPDEDNTEEDLDATKSVNNSIEHSLSSSSQSESPTATPSMSASKEEKDEDDNKGLKIALPIILGLLFILFMIWVGKRVVKKRAAAKKENPTKIAYNSNIKSQETLDEKSPLPPPGFQGHSVDNRGSVYSNYSGGQPLMHPNSSASHSDYLSAYHQNMSTHSFNNLNGQRRQPSPVPPYGQHPYSGMMNRSMSMQSQGPPPQPQRPPMSSPPSVPHLPALAVPDPELIPLPSPPPSVYSLNKIPTSPPKPEHQTRDPFRDPPTRQYSMNRGSNVPPLHIRPPGAVRARVSFKPTATDELAIHKGEDVQVLRRFSDGWAEVKALASGKTGVIPLQILDDQPSTPMSYGSQQSSPGYQPQGQAGFPPAPPSNYQ
ncbi:hypothetical protein E3Q12_01831 [Wallemia mellicola]|uniref:RING-type E3 ubiquitin transferase n=1 Tax=Wallemia mellicola TaxID=1708541 RepID=A0AB74KIR4_9BASI|nr:hypothetical protein E3Q12_01831 [Wallemia mellicola]TIC67860.1 hypothetical protein E3Q03_01822 [Wallemia mellicola]